MQKKITIPQQDKNSSSLDIIALLFLLLSSSVLFLTNLSGKSFIGDEIVYGYYLEDMYKPVNPIFPEGRLNDLYMIKPPLKTWLQYPLVKIFGFNYITLRFWDSFFAVLAVVLIYFIGKNLVGRKAGFIAAFGIMTIPAIVKEHWARYNGYDAGFIFAILLFYYLFLTSFDKKNGWVFCGIALSAAFYFKHIAAILHLLPIIIWLIITCRHRILFSRKSLAMLSVFLLFVFAWYIPFFIKNPSFISVFIKDELYRRILEGYNQSDVTIFFYFKTLTQRLGLWIYPVAISFITFSITTFFFWKQTDQVKGFSIDVVEDSSVDRHLSLAKKDKNLFLLCWILVPFIPLEISSSKLEWYLYPVYPALMIVTGKILCYFDQSLRKYSFKINPVFIFSLFFAFTMWFHNFSYVQKAAPSYSKVYADFYKNRNDGKIYTYLLCENDLNFSEKIDIRSTGRRIRMANRPRAFGILLSRLGDNDSLIMLRRELYRIIFMGLQPYEKGKHSYADITLHHEISAPKIIIFKKGGILEKYLKGNKFTIREVKPFRDQVDFPIEDNRVFVDDAFKIFFGFQLGGDKFQYIVDTLSKGLLTRDLLVKKFQCLAAREDYFIVRHWWEHFTNFATGKARTAEFISDYYSGIDTGTIYVYGMGWGGLTPEQNCMLLPVKDRIRFATEKFYPNLFNSLLPKLGERDIAIIKKRLLFESLPDDQRKREDAASYSFFSLGLEDVYPEDYGEYPFKAIICRSDGEIAQKLTERGMQLRRIRKPEELINWKIPSDDEYIKHIGDLIFSVKYNSYFLADLKKELDECDRNRRIFVDKQIKKILNEKITASKGYRRKTYRIQNEMH